MPSVGDIYGEAQEWEGSLACVVCLGSIHPNQDQVESAHLEIGDCIRHLRRENERLAVTVRKLERALIDHGALPKEARVATKRATRATKGTPR